MAVGGNDEPITLEAGAYWKVPFWLFMGTVGPKLIVSWKEGEKSFLKKFNIQ